MSPRAVAALLVLGLLAAGCGRRQATEDVRVRLGGAYLLLENRSGADIHFQLAASPMLQAYIPASLPGNRLESGRFQRWRIAPSQRGQTVEVHWWRPGREIDASGIRGPDRVRRLPVELLDPDPLPLDERAVRACIAANRAQPRVRPNLEAFCMDEAERCLNTDGGLCATMYHGWRRVLDEAGPRRGAP